MIKKYKLLSIIIAILIVFGAIYLSTSFFGEKATNVKRTIPKSDIYSNKEINNAMDAVPKEFKNSFKGCTLIELEYDEKISSSQAGALKRQFKADEAIVLTSSFDVDSSGGDGSLNPNSTYSNWSWILVKEKESKKWTVKDWGY